VTMQCNDVEEEAQVTNMPNLKTRTNVVRSAEIGHFDSDGVESETVREVMDEILSDMRLNTECK
jgi:hypothetical protein